MFGGWWKFGLDATMLTLEAQQVIGMRMMKLSAGGAAAQVEAERMVSEKVAAAGEAMMLLASGGSSAGVLAGYRRKVRANARRLSRGR